MCCINISHIRRYLTLSATKTLVQACVTSRLDYANALLYGLPNTSIQRLQRTQNAAARLVTKTKRKEHITPILMELHWLPVSHRIRYKVLLLVYKALHNLAPSYIADMVKIHQPARSLRSANTNQLSIPKTRLRSWGDRSFQYAAAFEWNNLPLAIRESPSLASFKECLKTFLF